MRVYLEVGRKKSFASAVEWPGWSRSGNTEEEAVDALLRYGERYGRSLGLEVSKLGLPARAAAVEIVERLEGNATIDFGAPGVVPELDRQPVSEARLDELFGLLRAAWRAFDRVAGAAAGRTLAPAGPRGGGRALDKIRSHVAEADAAYLRALGGVPGPNSSWSQIQQDFVDAAYARARGELPDEGPRGGKRWPAPYAIRRSAWHALDHAWEIEDRSAG